MSVLRGVTCYLAVLCVLGLVVSNSGCGKKTGAKSDKTGKSESKTESKTEKSAKTKTDDTDKKSKTDDPVKTKKTDDIKTENSAGKTAIEAKTPKTGPKLKKNIEDPIESGSGTKRKLRGPKLGGRR